MKKFREIRKSKRLTQMQAAKQSGMSLAKIRELERGCMEGVGVVELLILLQLYGVKYVDVWECMKEHECIHAQIDAREKVLIKWGVIKERISNDHSQSVPASN